MGNNRAQKLSINSQSMYYTEEWVPKGQADHQYPRQCEHYLLDIFKVF